jgi:ATP-binding cassette subfamily F protein 3
MLLQLEGIARHIGGRTLFRDLSLHVATGDRIAVVGPNGAGKSTLLRVAAGLDDPDEGRRHAAGQARIALLRQEIDPEQERSVREETSSVFSALAVLEGEIAAVEAAISEAGAAGQEPPPELATRYDALRERFAREGGFDRHARVDRVLAGLGFDEAARDRPLRAFSGGWLMRVELAKLLLAEPDVLLLDEPTNHLDLPSIAWFEEVLANFSGAVICVSHDRAFLDRHADRVVEVSMGRGELYEMGFRRYLAERARRAEQRRAAAKQQQREIAEQERFIERFRAKNTKARQVQSRVKALDKIERIEVDEPLSRRPRLRIPEPARAGATVVALQGLAKAYGENVVYEGLDFEIARGEKMALVGPNGAGKSTLLRIIAGMLDFDRGERVLGHNVGIAYYAQHQLEVLDPTRTVLEELAAGARFEDQPRLRGHLGAFLFSGDDVQKRVSVLSGGEKARLALAKLFLRPANFLVLDEPTNHLDIEAREVLEEALRDYAGTLLFISHDRALIENLAGVVCEVTPGRVERHLGGYAAYRERQGLASSSDVANAQPTNAAAVSGKAQRQRERELRKSVDRCKRRVARVETEIAEFEEALGERNRALSDPQVYEDRESSQRVIAEIEALTLERDQRYSAWEELSAELESEEAELAAALSTD